MYYDIKRARDTVLVTVCELRARLGFGLAYPGLCPVLEILTGMLWVILMFQVPFLLQLYSFRCLYMFLSHPLIYSQIHVSLMVSWPGHHQRNMNQQKHSHTGTLLPPCVTVGIRFFSLNAVFALWQTCHLFWCPNIPNYESPFKVLVLAYILCGLIKLAFRFLLHTHINVNLRRQPLVGRTGMFSPTVSQL